MARETQDHHPNRLTLALVDRLREPEPRSSQGLNDRRYDEDYRWAKESESPEHISVYDEQEFNSMAAITTLASLQGDVLLKETSDSFTADGSDQPSDQKSDEGASRSHIGPASIARTLLGNSDPSNASLVAQSHELPRSL
jgi:hypothetical protein